MGTPAATPPFFPVSASVLDLTAPVPGDWVTNDDDTPEQLQYEQLEDLDDNKLHKQKDSGEVPVAASSKLEEP